MEFHKHVVFTLSSTRTFGEMLAEAMGLSLGEHEERSLPDGVFAESANEVLQDPALDKIIITNSIPKIQ